MREKIGLHCDVISGYAFKTSDWKTEGVPVIKIGNISNGSDVIIDEATQYVDEEFLLSLNERFVVSRGDILISLTGSHINQPTSMVGRTCRNLSNNTYLLNQRAGKVMPFANTEKQYLYYLLSTKAIKYDIANRAYGGANQVNVSPTDIKNIKWDFPSKVIQSTIANILLKYDELIEVNNQRIKKLEQTAEELYKEWFVRFRFPNYQNTEFENGIPKGWIKTKLKEISLECGKQEKKENREKYNYYVPIDCLNSKSMSVGSFEAIDNAESSLISFRKNDILFGAMRPYFHKVTMMPFGGLTRSTCFVISPINESYRYYLYLTLFQKSSVDFATTVSVGSTMPYVRWNDFSRLSVIEPDINTVEMFNTQVIPIISEIHSLYFSNQTLIKQRDLLLPRLMSGKLEV